MQVDEQGWNLRRRVEQDVAPRIQIAFNLRSAATPFSPRNAPAHRAQGIKPRRPHITMENDNAAAALKAAKQRKHDARRRAGPNYFQS
jgi:hypothetical protein